MNPIAIRLLSQQLACPQFLTPSEVVSHLCAMQAQDYRMVRWAVLSRTKNASAETFRKAYDSGEIIRLHLLRGTWQLVSGKDYWWLLSLCASRAEAVIKGWMKSNKITIEDKELYSIREIFVRTAEAKGNVTKNDLVEALAEKDIKMDNHRLSYHIRMSELSGTLCSGDLSPMQATYTLAENKIKHTPALERDEMLQLLADKYFRSHSPATFEDFVRWSGMSVSDCQKAVSLLGNELTKEQWKGYNFYLHTSCRTRGFRKDSSLLLAPYDEYLIGYKSRELAIKPEHFHHAYTNNGIFFPVIAHEGIICGKWSPWEKKLKTTYFIPNANEPCLKEQYNTFDTLKAEIKKP